MNKTCGNCRFKGKPITYFDYGKGDPCGVEVDSGHFLCDRIKHEERSSYEIPKTGAYVVDGSGYYAALCVADDFGCNLWEAK